MMKIKTLACMLLVTMVVFSPLMAQGATESQDSGKPVIGLVMKSLGAEFFKSMEEGAKAHAIERGDLILKPL